MKLATNNVNEGSFLAGSFVNEWIQRSDWMERGASVLNTNSL